MPTRDMVVVGTSAGGVQALQELVSFLPADFAGAMFIVLHMSPDAHSRLPDILSRHGPLRASFAEDKERVRTGRIYIAPPNCHLLVEPNQMRVVHGPKENRHRPAIDPLFRSAAWAYGPRVAGVILSGLLDDGTAGLWAVKTCGGLTIVQDSQDAVHAEMPRNAALVVDVDYTLPVSKIGPLLVKLACEPIAEGETVRPETMKTEIEFAKMHRDITDMSTLGKLSPFTCPTCRGALWQLEDDDILRYRCHTGHAFSKDSLLVEQTDSIEEALYSALRAVEEKAATMRRLGERYTGRSDLLMNDYQNKARDLEGTAETLREMLASKEH